MDYFVYFLSYGSPSVALIGLHLPGLSHALALATRVAEMTGILKIIFI